MNPVNEADIVRALEAHPSIAIQPGFTERVLQRLPAQHTRYAPVAGIRFGFGRVVMLCAMAALLTSMALLASTSTAQGTWLAVQAVLLLEFSPLVLYTAWLQGRA